MDLFKKRNKQIIINLFDKVFAHVPDSSVPFHKPKLVKWKRKKIYRGNWNLYTDSSMFNKRIQKPALGWLIEPQMFISKKYKKIPKVEKRFKYIFTYSPNLLARSSKKYKPCPIGGMWVRNPSIQQKTKICSMIYSRKKKTYGHRLRHKVAQKIRSFVDMYGYPNRIQFKEESLEKHMFSIVIESISCGYYFSEKLIDCFATGTIPIYWGSTRLSEYFNMSGVFMLPALDKLQALKSVLTPELYKSKLSAIYDNFERCMKFQVPEDWICQNYLLQK